MKDVIYKGEYAYCVIDGQTFRKDVPENVSDELAAKAKKSDEPFEVKNEPKDESGD